MKRKLLIALLALTLLAMLTACGDYEEDSVYTDADTDADYYELYEYDIEADYEDEISPEAFALEMYNKMMQHLSFPENDEFWALDIDAIIRVGMNVLGERYQMNIETNVRMIYDDGHTEMATTISMDMREPGFPSLETEIEMYMLVYNDIISDYIMIVDGEDLTAFLPVEVVEEAFYDAFNTTSTMPEFGESAIREVKVEEFADRTVIEMVVYADELGEFIADLMEEELDAFAVDYIYDIDVADVYFTMTIDSDGNPVSLDMEIRMLLRFQDDITGEMYELSGGEAQIRMSILSVINAVGDDVEIIWPEVETLSDSGAWTMPEIWETAPDPSGSGRSIVVPDDPSELITFIELFDLDSVVITDENTGRQLVNVFPSVGTLERLEIFYEATGILIDPMHIMQSGELIFLIFLDLPQEQRQLFTLLLAANGF